MITVYGSNPCFGLPEASPFVTKTIVQLKMAGLPYRTAPAIPDQSPKGQIPFIDDDGAVIADSTFIRAYLEDKFVIDLDAGLTFTERAQSWAIERMVENHLATVAGWSRWLIAENFEKGPARWFDNAPEGMRADVLGRVTAGLRAQGIARHAPDEIVGLGARSLDALSTLLADKPFLFGDRPTGVDAVAFAVLAEILTPFFESPIRRAAESYPNLTAYTARMMARFFPEHVWEGGFSAPPREESVPRAPRLSTMHAPTGAGSLAGRSSGLS